MAECIGSTHTMEYWATIKGNELDLYQLTQRDFQEVSGKRKARCGEVYTAKSQFL